MTPSCALYVRVSTRKDQDPELQLSPLRELAGCRGFVVVEEYVDIGVSGAKERRPALDRLMADARRRRFEVVLVWRFDRFARSTRHLVNALHEFRHLGIAFCSYQENLDTTSPMGEAMFAIIGAMAQLERDIIRERIQAGVARAKEKGKNLGRPRRVFHRDEVATLRAEGLSFRKIGRRLGISPALALRVYRDGEAGQRQRDGV
jgi:DNA invertase Pin-like site-specific DNA recombinase